MVLAGEARNGGEAVQVFRALRPAGRPGAQLVSATALLDAAAVLAGGCAR
jgi:hypothetical protein